MFKPVETNMDFPKMEKRWLDHWYKTGVVKKYLDKNKKSTKYFSFLDGPITANNPMGVHHAWGRTYKDLWPRFHNLLGEKQRFQNGFDCQGLWVEVEVEKELGLKNKKEIENLVPGDRKASIARFVELCKQRVYKYSKIQTDQSKRLGYFADWEHSYFTMSDSNNYMIWHFLKKCYEHGWIYKGRESVPWCPRCETAISQHEMLTEDYKEIVHESVYIKYKVKSQKLKAQEEYLLVWTTTPWTLLANIAVAVDMELDYVLVKTEKSDLLWVAKDAVARVISNYKVIKTVKGKMLVGLRYETAFDHLPAVERAAKKNPRNFHVVIPTDKNILPISTSEGTGLVHTAVSAGVEDFKLGKKLGLPMIPVIADNADYLPGLGEFTGKNAKKNPRVILDYLQEKKAAFKIHQYKHRYPACWRCKAELVWKVEDEWYIAMDKPSKLKIKNLKLKISTLRERMINVAKSIRWMPEFGLERELDWLKNMDDWLISKKNRYWGLALPIYECKQCGKFEVIGSKEELEERATKGWKQFNGQTPHKPFIDEVLIKCTNCDAPVKRIDDVGNPWLDAGIVPYSTIAENNQGKPLYLQNNQEWRKWFPIDFITESFPGQFKNWFYAMIAESTVLENINPFKRVLGYGILLGEDGRPMHKSWGNSIEFNEGADKIGVDVMRWMFSRQNPADNLLFGYKKADEVRRQFYLMLWNVYKFFVEYSNLDKFQIPNHKSQIILKSKAKNLKNILDQWILVRFNWLVDSVEKSLREFNAKDAALAIEKFVSDLSLWYIRRSRDRVWVNTEDNQDKENFYQTTYFILVNLSIIISPFLPFVSEEIYTNLTGNESVHLEVWSHLRQGYGGQAFFNKQINMDMEILRKIAENGRRVRKELKLKLRQPLAKVEIALPKTSSFRIISNLDQYNRLLEAELNVKKVVWGKEPTKKEEITISFNTQLSSQLIKEGELRDLVRQIQSERKKIGIYPDRPINLTIPEKFSSDSSYLKKKVIADKITYGASVKITI